MTQKTIKPKSLNFLNREILEILIKCQLALTELCSISKCEIEVLQVWKYVSVSDCVCLCV